MADNIDDLVGFGQLISRSNLSLTNAMVVQLMFAVRTMLRANDERSIADLRDMTDQQIIDTFTKPNPPE